jgi:hypothetical protein
MSDDRRAASGVNVTSAMALTQTVPEPPIEDQVGSDLDAIVTPQERESLLATLGTIKLTPAEQRICDREPDPRIVAIKPTGEVYIPAVFYRTILNEAFKRRWGLRPFGAYRLDLRSTGESGKSIVFREYGLVVKSVLISIVHGECEYHPTNVRMTYGDALEGVRSNALMRLGKDFGIYPHPWMPSWVAAFRRSHCVQMFVTGNKEKPQWRRLDQDPFWNETKPTKESPNQDRWEEMRSAALHAKAGVGNDDTIDGQWSTPSQMDVVDTARPATSEPVETIIATRTLPSGRHYGVKGSASGEAVTDDVSVYRWAQDCARSKKKVYIFTETRTRPNNGEKYRWLVEIRPAVAGEDVNPF